MLAPKMRELERLVLDKLGAARFKLWFDRRVSLCLQEDRVLVKVPNKHYQEWLSSKFRKEIEASARELTGFAIPAFFEIENTQDSEYAAMENKPLPTRKSQPGAECSFTQKAKDSSSQGAKRLWHRFDAFCVGQSNKVAFDLAKSASELNAEDCNPLVIHGPHGCGKSHLLEAVFHAFTKSPIRKQGEFLTAEEFTSQFVQSMQKNQMVAFRNRWRNRSLVVIDDLHLLAQKPATQKEFLITMDALQRQGAVLVVSLDGHPRFLDKLMPELVDRLLSGAVVQVDHPETALRSRIVNQFWEKQSSLPLQPETVEFIAREVTGNVRQIQGVVKNLLNHARIQGEFPGLEKAKQFISGAVRGVIKTPSLSSIEDVVTGLFKLPAQSLRLPDREMKKKLARAVAMFLGRKFTQSTFRELGKFFGNRNHSSVVCAEKKIAELLQSGESCLFDGTEHDLGFLIQQAEQRIRNLQG